MWFLLLVLVASRNTQISVYCLAFKSIRVASSTISADCKKDEGSIETNDWTTCMRYCSVEKCNGMSSLVENGKCHCIDDSCVPDKDGFTGDAIIMTSKSDLSYLVPLIHISSYQNNLFYTTVHRRCEGIGSRKLCRLVN